MSDDFCQNEQPPFDEGDGILIGCAIWCGDVEYEVRYFDGYIPVWVPVEQCEEEEE